MGNAQKKHRITRYAFIRPFHSEKGKAMQEQDLMTQQPAELPIAIKSNGLSAEAKGMFDMIAKRAHEIFESKGGVNGRDLEHWLQAEAELFERTPINLKEPRDAVTVPADVRGFTPKELEVDLEPKRVTIIRKTNPKRRKNGWKALFGDARDATASQPPAYGRDRLKTRNRAARPGSARTGCAKGDGGKRKYRTSCLECQDQVKIDGCCFR